MTVDTRRLFLDNAKRLFASKGFYGASLANIADELGLTKQALLHHFGNKEKLYGEILGEISDRMLAAVTAAGQQHESAAAQLETALLNIYTLSAEHPEDTRILMRELLDVERRTGDVHTWYMKPFLDALIGMVRQLPSRAGTTPREALALIYPLLGAINYLIASEVVLEAMYGRATYPHMRSRFPAQLGELVQGLVGESAR